MNDATNNGGPAFPVPGWKDDADFNGMTLRDYFAAKALQGLLSDSEVQGTPHEFAERAYSMASAMLRVRGE